jgi:hypothetical protein
MSTKVSITLDDDVLNFVDGQTENRSGFINEVLAREKKRILLQELEAAYIEQSGDAVFQEEFATWDVTVGDGILTDA